MLKIIDYEQIRDGEAVSAANGRTKAKYGELTAREPGSQQSEQRSTGLSENASRDTLANDRQPANAHGNENEDSRSGTRPLETGQDADLVDHSTARDEYDSFVHALRIQLTDDIDDEAVLGRNRRRKKMARTNSR